MKTVKSIKDFEYANGNLRVWNLRNESILNEVVRLVKYSNTREGENNFKTVGINSAVPLSHHENGTTSYYTDLGLYTVIEKTEMKLRGLDGENEAHTMYILKPVSE